MAVRDPYAKKNFRLEIDGISPGGFETAQGLSWETEVIEFQEGGRNDALVRLPGQGRLGKVTLTRGFIGGGDLYAWARLAREGKGARKPVDVVVLNDASEEVARYTLLRAWPTRYETKELSGQQGHAVEAMELAHEGIVKSSHAPAPAPASGAGVFGAVQSALASAEQRARDGVREARQTSDAAADAARAVATAGGIAAAVVGGVNAAASLGEPPAFLPAPPAVASGASPLDAAFAANVGPPASPGAGQGVAPGGVRDAMVQGSPPGNVVPHGSAESFSSALADGGPPPSPVPSPSGAPAAGLAASGATGAAATSAGDWSDGASRQQPPGQLREPPIQSGNTLHF